MRRRGLLLLLLPGLLLPGLAAAQTRQGRRRAPPRPSPRRPPAQALPEIDPAPRAGLAPVPDRRFPTPEQAARPETRLLPVVPTGNSPTRGSSFAERDINPESLGRRDSFQAQPGLSVRTPIR